MKPNAEYETAVMAFVADILDGQKSRQFLDAFRPIQRRVCHQLPRFVSYGLQGRTEVRLARGETFGPAVATTNTVPAADLIAQALYEYMKTPHGREKVEELIRTTGLV